MIWLSFLHTFIFVCFQYWRNQTNLGATQTMSLFKLSSLFRKKYTYLIGDHLIEEKCGRNSSFRCLFSTQSTSRKLWIYFTETAEYYRFLPSSYICVAENPTPKPRFCIHSDQRGLSVEMWCASWWIRYLRKTWGKSIVYFKCRLISSHIGSLCWFYCVRDPRNGTNRIKRRNESKDFPNPISEKSVQFYMI